MGKSEREELSEVGKGGRGRAKLHSRKGKKGFGREFRKDCLREEARGLMKSQRGIPLTSRANATHEDPWGDGSGATM